MDGTPRLTLPGVLRLLDVRPRHFLVPVAAGVLESFFGLVVLGLFLPLIRLLVSAGTSDNLGRFAFILKHFEGAHSMPMLLGLLLIAALLRGLAAYVSRVTVARQVVEAEARLGGLVLGRYLAFGQQYFDLRRSGMVLNRIRKLPGQAARAIPLVHRTLVGAATVALFFAAMAAIWWQLALVTLVFLAAYYVGFTWLTRRIEMLAERVDDVEDQSAAAAQELISNLSLVRRSGTRGEEMDAWRRMADERKAVRWLELRFLEMVNPMKNALGVVILLLIAFACSFLTRDVDAGLLPRAAVFFFVVRRCVGALSDVLRTPNEWANVERRAERLADLLDDDEKYLVPGGTAPATPLRGDITFRDLSFAYAGKPNALDRVTCRFRCGQFTAIVGRTGSGKSTLLRLLLRQYDSPPGALLVDGVDLREVDLEQHLGRIAYVGGEPEFFDDTVRANVCYGAGTVSPAALEEVAAVARADAFVRNLPGGWDERVGVGGSRLSAGERQRLAIMRILLRDPELILLDEATSALDPETEADVLSGLRSRFRSRTIVSVMHRLHRITPDAWVVVMQEGRVAEEGTCADLLTRGTALAALWPEEQAVEVEDGV